MATHSPMLMAYPNARLLRLSKYGLEPVTVEETDTTRSCGSSAMIRAGFVEGGSGGIITAWVADIFGSA